MNILITGALGHIGSYLIHNAFRWHKVLAVDNMLTQRYCSLLDLKSNVTFRECEFLDIQDDVLETMDVIVHLAAITDAASSFSNAANTDNVNSAQTAKFISRISRLPNKPLFIFPSSTSIYGIASEQVTEDEPEFINPQSPYAESKVRIEQLLAESDLNYRALRLGTIFGTSKGMRFHTAINKFCYQSAFGMPLTIWRENYEQHRPYLGLDDARQMIEMMALGKGEKGVYNVITGNYKLSEIVDMMQDILGENEVALNFVDTPLLNQYPYKVDGSKAEAIGYHPINNISSAIRLTLRALGKRVSFQ